MRLDNRPVPRGAHVLAWVLVLVGGLLTSWGLVHLLDARASADWPSVDGEVLTSTVKLRRSRSGSSSTDSFRYAPEVSYRYAVDGESLVGRQISFRDDHYGKRRPAFEIASRYEVGAPVTVYYKPGDPGQAVIDLHWDWSTYLPVGISGFIFLVGCFLVRALRRRAIALQPRDPA